MYEWSLVNSAAVVRPHLSQQKVIGSKLMISEFCLLSFFQHKWWEQFFLSSQCFQHHPKITLLFIVGMSTVTDISNWLIV